MGEMLNKVVKDFSSSEVRWLQSSPANTSFRERAMPKSTTTQLGFPSQNPVEDWEGWTFSRCYLEQRGRALPKLQIQSSGEENTSRSVINSLAIALTLKTAAGMRQLLRGLIAPATLGHMVISNHLAKPQN